MSLYEYGKLGIDYLSHMLKFYLSVCLKKTYTHPFSLHLFLTGRCNLRCQMCPAWKQKDKEELELSEWKQIIAEAARYGVRLVTFGGTEPLLYKHLFEIIETAHQYKMIPSLVTNGTLIDFAMARKLLSVNLFRIGVSLDGACSETHDSIRGVKGSFNRTLNGLKYLTKLRSEMGTSTKIYINTIIMEENLREILDIVKLAELLGVKFLCQPYISHLIGDDGTVPPQEELVVLVEELKKIKKKKDIIINPIQHLDFIKRIFTNGVNSIKCPIGYDMLSVGPNGEVWLCQHFVFSQDSMLGNIKENNIESIWYSKNFEKARRKALNCREKCGLNCKLPVVNAYWFIYDEFISPIFRKL